MPMADYPLSRLYGLHCQLFGLLASPLEPKYNCEAAFNWFDWPAVGTFVASNGIGMM